MFVCTRVAAGCGLLSLAVAASACRREPAPARAQPELKAVVSIKELMENVIDPIADNVFDAVTSDVTAKGIIETKPTTDDDWAKVRQGGVMLAEASNLLKIPRAVAPRGDQNKSQGPNAPELSPDQIRAKIDQDPALWNRHADELREVALKVLASVDARNADALFEAGGTLDKTCENCHLDYWYPGDRKAVLEDEQKRATITKKK